MIISPTGKQYSEHRLMLLQGDRPIVCTVLVQEGYKATACWRDYINIVNATRPYNEPYNTFVAIEPLLLQ